jgi:hypothetical protein
VLTITASVVSAESVLNLTEWNASKPFLITGVLSSERVLVIQDGLYFTCQLNDKGEFIDLSQCKPILTAGLRQQISTAEAAQVAAESAAAAAAAAVGTGSKAPIQETTSTDQAKIDEALADATSPDTTSTKPDATKKGSDDTNGQPLGAALNSGEIDNLRQIIGPFWNIGSLSTEASRVTVTMRVQFSEDQKVLSVEMVDFTGGTAEAAQQAFEAAKRAIFRGASMGLGLPPDSYESWKSILITFDTSEGRIR